MHDSEYPSIWGVHNEALFNPVLVRGRLVTAVESAPAAWSDRLEELGFKKGSRAWLRMGATAPSEYEYISPAILLKAFKPEDVLNTEAEFNENPVPLTVQDAIASLWQNNLDGVLFELSMLGVGSRSAAWSHVEAAMQGDETPEAVAVTELAFARMQKLGTLLDAALDYAALKGWVGVTPEQLQVRGGIVISSGESVHWADHDGVFHKGRLAMTLRQADVDAWVYEEGPRFVGGVAIASLSKVGRQQIQFLDAGQNWQVSSADYGAAIEPERHAMQALAPELTRDEVPSYFSLAGYTEEAGDEVKRILADAIFPSEGWREELQQKLFALPESGPLGVEIFEALERVESDLYSLSKHYYGNTGVGFCLSRHFSSVEDESNIEMSLGNYNRDGFYSIDDGIDGLPVLKAERIDYGVIAEALDAQHRKNVQRFIRGTTALGLSAETSPAMPSEFISSYRVTNVLNELGASGFADTITVDQLASILATVSGRNLLAKHIAEPARNDDTSSLELLKIPVSTDNQITPRSSLALSITNISQPITTLDAVLRKLHGSGVGIAESTQAKYSLAVAYMQYPGSRHLEMAEAIPGLSFFSSMAVEVQPLPSFEMAEQAMTAAIDFLDVNRLVGDQHDELQVAAKKLNSYPLTSRYYAAIVATKLADPDELRAWVENELRNGFKGKINQLSTEFFKRQVAYIADEIRGNEGVVVSLSTGSTRSVRRYPVSASDSSLAESREATLGAAIVKVKERHRMKGSTIALDAISFSDPALCSLLAGERAAVEKDRVNAGQVYEDAGVVAGFARKDIRAFSRDALIDHASRMSTEQKEKYLKRELIWPRKSFEEMRDEGVLLQTAIAVDILWKALPKAPKSPAIKHVRSFTELVSMMRDEITNLMGRIRSGDQQDANPGSADYASRKLLLNDEFKHITKSICQADVVKETYRVQDFKVRGVSGMSLSGFEPFSQRSLSMTRLLNGATWAKYLKEKKVARPAAKSRVQRGEVVREGEDYRNGVSVVTEDFLKTFAFSGVEYGNWTNQKEREAHLNLSYDSMMDFAKLVGWEPMALSLGGRLGLCIGSRGHGGANSFAAHFEPVNYAMNLTRLSGDGSLAHEYWHAVANHFGHIHTGRPTDLLNNFGYALQIKGPLPTLTGSSLREPVRKAFRDLQVAIMRDVKPGGDVNNIEDYTDLSAMMKCSIEMGEYWAEPAEMFARAMEMWVVDQMEHQGYRNDYLVRAGKGGGQYPTPEHLERISKWVEPLLESIELEVRKVSHPLLGDIEIPILHSEHRSATPLPPQDLVDLALSELDRLFKRAAPRLMFISEPGGKAGLYKAAINLMALNDAHADRDTFYHEAWHACEATLLTSEERSTMREVFAPSGALSVIVIDAMRAEGLSEGCVAAAMNNHSEMQAYAFQLWAADKLDLSEKRISEFYRVKGFADGVVEVAAMLGSEKATAIFSQFLRGDFSSRFASGLEASAGVSVHLARAPVLEERQPIPSGPSMRM